MEIPQQRLSNGLRIRLHSDATASRAAALVQVDVGSHHEPENWPGLAHLLEHLLFAGSHAYPDEQRLMAWLPAQGGRLNASTQGSSTAYYFECAPDLLAQGLARLGDMLCAPLLAPEAIRQETAIIDAECRLLSQHQATLGDAALSMAFEAHPWQRFQVGNAASFGDDITALGDALRHFHQRYYHAGTLTLWLQGPQSLEQLAALAQRFGQAFSARERLPTTLPALCYQPLRDVALQLPGVPRLRLAFLLADIRYPALSLLRQLLLDEADGSLMAALRAENLCDGVQLQLPYRSAQQAVVAIELVLADAQRVEEVEGRVHHWLQRLADLSDAQRRHYIQLACREFSHLPVMDQLRERTSGFAPGAVTPSDWSTLLAQLCPQRMARQWIGASAQPERCTVQGFAICCQRKNASARAACAPETALRFFPRVDALFPASLPDAKVTLIHRQPARDNAVLLLSPLDDLPAPWGQILQARLRALAANCAHQGGDLAVSCQQGQWLIQLHAGTVQMLPALAALIRQLSDITPAAITQGERAWQRQRQAGSDDIAVRTLLNALPAMLSAERYQLSGSTLPPLAWQAVLEGGDDALACALSRLLSAFPGSINPPFRTPSETPSAPEQVMQIATRSREAALLRFCPLVENSAHCLAAWQQLALIYQPLFFQRLRVEQKIGYAVSCRFYQAAGRSGILFALQSPHLSSAELSARIDRFLAEAGSAVAAVSAGTLREQGKSLLDMQQLHGGDVMQQSRQRWLNTQYPQPDAADMAALTPALLLDYHQRLVSGEQPARTLVNIPLD